MLPRWRQVEMHVLDESQVSQFLVAAQGSPHDALYHLAITSRMRQGVTIWIEVDRPAME